MRRVIQFIIGKFSLACFICFAVMDVPKKEDFYISSLKA
jgi:hypothetical protein